MCYNVFLVLGAQSPQDHHQRQNDRAARQRNVVPPSGNIFQKAKALVPILVPLFISAFRRADELATAMECRCYHGGEGRTRLKQLKFTAEDTRCAVVITVLLVCICLTRLFVPGLA